MFEGKSVADLIAIAAAGGGIETRASGRSTSDLILIAGAAKRGQAKLYLRGLAGRSQSDLLLIAQAGGGAVVFADPLPE